MADPTTALIHTVQKINYIDAIRACIIVGIGWLLAKGVRALIGRIFQNRFNPGVLLTLQRTAYFIIQMLFVVSALRQIGFHLEILLGAAGVFTVAFGFAAQTSTSNLVSGLFLFAERPFFIGDTIKVDDITGKVLSIDLLSTKLRMDDNTYIRIPNELLIKSKIANISRFSTRRFEISLLIAANAHLERVKNILIDIANHEPLALKDPKPFIKQLELNHQGIKLQLLVWGNMVDGDILKNSLISKINAAFKEQDIQLGSDKAVYILGNEHDKQYTKGNTLKGLHPA